MLKTREVYLVSVTLNDGQALLCTLLSKPDSLTLAAVATAQNAPADFSKVLALAADIAVPALGEKAVDTAIIVVDTIIGTVRVETQQAYGLPVKRPRKPKTDAPADATAAPATGKKRGRKAKAAPVETPVDAQIVNPDNVTA
jgi:hypothetical protein